MRLAPQFHTISFLMVIALHAEAACIAGFAHQADSSTNDQPVSPILLQSMEQEASDGLRLLENSERGRLYAERLFRAQNQARYLDTLLESMDALAGKENFSKDSNRLDAMGASRRAMALIGKGNLDAALKEISKLEYINQLAAIRNATAWCIETGKTEWVTPILEFDFDSRAPENEVWSTKAQIEETIRPLCLRDLALKNLMAGNREQASKLALDAVSQVLDCSGGAAYYGIVNDLDTFLDLAGRCGVMKEAWERIRLPLLDGMLTTFAADSIALRLAHAGLKDELDELVDACETADKRLQCNAAAAWGFATAGDTGEAIIRVEKAQADIPHQQARSLDPDSLSYLVGACCLAGKRDVGAALIKQRVAGSDETDYKFINALFDRADPDLILDLPESLNVLRRHLCAVAVARACKREKKEDVARSWLRAKTDELGQSKLDFSTNGLTVANLASAWGILGEIEEADSLLRKMQLPDYSDRMSFEEFAKFERFGGPEAYRMVAENLVGFNEPEVLVEWVTGLEHPIARAHAALGLFQGFAARNHRLEGWYPR